jgi:hypothetical protein
MTAPEPPILRFDPEPSCWAALLDPAPLTDEQRTFRAQLDLPTDRPVIMSGHQPTIWHPGILAKYIAASAAADSFDAHASWLVVGHVVADAHSIEYPTADYSRARLPITPPASDQTIAARTPPLNIREDELKVRGVLPTVQDGAARILDALQKHQTMDSLAQQLSHATQDLLRGFTPPLQTICSTRFAGTDLFIELLARMRADPNAAAKTYNAAIRTVPHTGIAPLGIDESNPGSTEMPVWVIRDDGSRRKAFARDLDTANPDRFSPRALLNTGVARLAGCDLFIHGSGGAAYDLATERWFESWLGRSLSPAVLVSADLFLPIEHNPASEQTLEHARWTLHHARHNPAVLSDAKAASAKQKLLNEIEDARLAGLNPDALYREMHTLLDAYNSDHSKDFDTLRTTIESAERAARVRSLACDRGWAFPLYAPDLLEQFARSISACFAPACCSAAR